MKRLAILTVALLALFLTACEGDASRSTAGFTAITSGLSIQITDTSSGGRAWHYSFGDLASSTDRQPIHTYRLSGTYPIRQTVCPNDDFTGDRCDHAEALVTVSAITTSTVEGVSIGRINHLTSPW